MSASATTPCACTRTRRARPTRTRSDLHLRRRQRALPDHVGQGRSLALRIRLLRPAAENAAIKAGTHPRIFTEARIIELKSSLIRLGAVYDWRREIRSHDPEIIRWSQTIFLEFLKAGLAYRAEAPVNWCPGCGTVLANEQVLPDGTCERSGDLVERRTSNSGSSRSPTTPRSCCTTSTHSSGRTREGDAAQLDWAQRRR